MNDIRLDEQQGMVIAMENVPRIVCLDGETLDVVSSVGLEDHGEFAIAPLDGKAIVGLDEQYHLTIHRTPGLKAIGIIDIWEAMARSKDEEIRRIGMLGEGEESYIMSPEFTQLETFRTPGENGAATLIVTEIAGLEERCIALTVAIDLVEGAATMATLDDLGDEIAGGGGGRP